MTALPIRPTTLAARPSVLHASRGVWAGRVISTVVTALLVMDMSMKLLGAKAAIEGSAQLGFTPHDVLVIGLVQLVCLVLYLVPRTAPLGAALWTAYFGGAVVTHMRLHNPLLTHVLSGVYVATLLWVGLWLRDARVRALLGPTR